MRAWEGVLAGRPYACALTTVSMTFSPPKYTPYENKKYKIERSRESITKEFHVYKEIKSRRKAIAKGG